jgi:hypothetical protein
VPSIVHETVIDLFRKRPTLAATLIRERGVALATHDEVRLESESLADCKPAEYRADAVIVHRAEQVAARKFVEGLMALGTHEYKSDYVRQWVAEGAAEAAAETRARDIIVAFRTRGIPVSPEAERRILECSDVDQLSAWFPKSIIADSVEELFDSE